MAEMQVHPGGSAHVSLNAATATGAGAAMDYFYGRAKFGVNVQTTGTPTSFNINIEGCIGDPAVAGNWFTLQAITTAGYTAIVDKPVRAIRANLTTITGGTAPTFTAQIVAA